MQHENFGEITFVSSSRTKRIIVHILCDGLKVTHPCGVTEKAAMEFIDTVSIELMQKQAILREQTPLNRLVIDQNTEWRTLSFGIKTFAVARKELFFSLENGLLRVEHPLGLDFGNQLIQQKLWEGVCFFLRKEAKRLFPKRVDELAKEHSFSYSVVKIQASKTRWGSCSSAKNINLSLYLMLLPQHLVDYVMLHELCHTKEMNHSVKFWQLMDRVTGNSSAALRAELKKYQLL
ncbi:MAG: M48 family metallopeptidase [Prevotellaceae bacterium]|jgi:predicted metal-dependent hydrolase|nr:M48 family metallopeptidase [Prevotellaceae bacterium]